jgi:hypothetical protein
VFLFVIAVSEPKSLSDVWTLDVQTLEWSMLDYQGKKSLVAWQQGVPSGACWIMRVENRVAWEQGVKMWSGGGGE